MPSPPRDEDSRRTLINEVTEAGAQALVHLFLYLKLLSNDLKVRASAANSPQTFPDTQSTATLLKTYGDWPI